MVLAAILEQQGLKCLVQLAKLQKLLYEKYGVPVLIMADGPAGIRLQRSYEVNRENDSVMESVFLVLWKMDFW